MKKKVVVLLCLSALLILGAITTMVVSVAPAPMECVIAVNTCMGNCAGDFYYDYSPPISSFQCKCMKMPGPGHGCPWVDDTSGTCYNSPG